MKVVLGSDHGGFNLKNAIKEHLTEKGIEVFDVGTHDGSSCNYPDIAKKVADLVVDKSYDKGILVCGTGIGISLAANKVRGIRAAVCSDHFSAKYTRLHNDANILCMGERVIGIGTGLELADIFLETEFEGGRHQTRVDMITELENN